MYSHCPARSKTGKPILLKARQYSKPTFVQLNNTNHIDPFISTTIVLHYSIGAQFISLVPTYFNVQQMDIISTFYNCISCPDKKIFF